MTLAEAKEVILNEGQFVTRDAWVKQYPADTAEEAYEVSHLKVLMRHGNYEKPVAELWSGPLAATAKFFNLEAVAFQPHIDCLEMDDSNTAKLHIGWQPTHEDEWASDYSVITLDGDTSEQILSAESKIPTESGTTTPEVKETSNEEPAKDVQ